MLINKNDYQQIKELLERKHWEGFGFIGYDKDDGPADRYGIDFFTDQEQAAEFCKDNPRRDYLATKSAYRAMANGIRDPSLLAYTDGMVDIAGMVSNYHQRLSKEQKLNNKNKMVMIDNNFDYLNNQVIYGGFKAIPSDELRKQMELNQKEFQLAMDTTYGTDKVKATLNFSKSDKSELYFFNHFDIEVLKEGQHEALKQRFYINNRGSSITLKEAYNLLEGRAVHKTLTNKNEEKYDAWIQLDFKNAKEDGSYKMNTYSEKYGFDLEKTLAMYPIKELENHQFRDGLLDSLKRGNRQAVTLVKDGKESKRFIEATPQYKGINFYDEHNRNRITESTKQSQKGKQETAENQQSASNDRAKQQQSSKEQKVSNETAEGEAGAKKKSSRRKMSA